MTLHLRRILPFVFCVLVALVIAGCGGGSDETTDDDAPSTSSPDRNAQDDAGNSDEDASVVDSTAAIAGRYVLDTQALLTAVEEKIRSQMSGESEGMIGMAVALTRSKFAEIEMTVTLESDGSALGAMNINASDEVGTGTWTLDGDRIAITLGSPGKPADTANGTVKGDTIEMDELDGQGAQEFKLIFKKVQG